MTEHESYQHHRRRNLVGHAVIRGLRGMGQSLHVQVLAVITIAVCMVLLGASVLLWQNARAITRQWGLEVPVTVYMEDGVAAERVAGLQARIAELPEVNRVDWITPEQAMTRLVDGLGGRPSLVAGLDSDTLPVSLEVHLSAEVGASFASALAEQLQQARGVEEVAALGEWAREADVMLDTVRRLVLGMGALVSLACLTIVWSTIRLGVFARRSEIEIVRLVGGTSAFVTGPFLVEGLLQGLLGTGLALGLLQLGFDTVRVPVEQGLSLVLAAGGIRFFTPLEIAVGLALGGLLGVLGSRAAVARYVEV